MKESYTLKLEGKEWKDCLKSAYNKKKKDIKMDGFRKGNVPYDIYVKHNGIEPLFMDAVDEAVDTLYTKLLADPKTIVPAATPSIDIKNIDKDHIEVEFTLVANPEVKLGKYKDLGIKRDKIEVTKEEIDHELGHLKEQFVELKACDDKTKIKNGMVAVIDFEGFVNGEAFKGGKGEDYNLEIGSNTFIPGFEDALVGLKKGDKKDVEVTFPENYHADDLKGKPAVFKVEIKDVKERVFPEFNKEFFEDLNIPEVTTEEELRNYIKAEIEHEKSHKVEDDFLFKCLDKVVENSKFEIPEEMTNDEINRIVKEFREKLQYQGLNFEDYLKFAKTNLDDFKETLKPEANKRVGYRLVMDAVVNKEKLEVNDMELESELEKAAEQYKMTKEEFVKELGNTELFKYDLVVKKAMKIITGEEDKKETKKSTKKSE